jgi:hypothetical protein
MRTLKQRNDTGPTTSACDNAVISTRGASIHCPLSVTAGGARWLVISGQNAGIGHVGQRLPRMRGSRLSANRRGSACPAGLG